MSSTSFKNQDLVNPVEYIFGHKSTSATSQLVHFKSKKLAELAFWEILGKLSALKSINILNECQILMQFSIIFISLNHKLWVQYNSGHIYDTVVKKKKTDLQLIYCTIVFVKIYYTNFIIFFHSCKDILQRVYET